MKRLRRLQSKLLKMSDALDREIDLLAPDDERDALTYMLCGDARLALVQIEELVGDAVEWLLEAHMQSGHSIDESRALLCAGLDAAMKAPFDWQLAKHEMAMVVVCQVAMRLAEGAYVDGTGRCLGGKNHRAEAKRLAKRGVLAAIRNRPI